MQVVELAHEVVAHLRQVAGSDTLLEAFNSARANVRAAREERKRQQAVQVSVSKMIGALAQIQNPTVPNSLCCCQSPAASKSVSSENRLRWK